MGADLYIRTIYDSNQARYEKQFNEAVRARDAAVDPRAREEAQKLVNELYDKLHSEGYFRDSYNDTSLLWKFGLSWWQDVPISKKGKMAPRTAKAFLKNLREHEDIFEKNMADLALSKDWPLSHEEVEEYFRDKYEKFKAFVNLAIELGEHIECSV